jgi:hypothetical protein
MAILGFQCGFFELTLLERQFPDAQGIDRTWIDCRVVLSMSAGSESMTIRNVQNVYVQDTAFPRLFRGVKRFLDDCKQDRLAPEFEFVPLELAFNLTFVDGDVSEDLQEGGVIVRIMVNLNEMVDLKRARDYIGGRFHVGIKQLLQFLEELQLELSSLN